MTRRLRPGEIKTLIFITCYQTWSLPHPSYSCSSCSSSCSSSSGPRSINRIRYATAESSLGRVGIVASFFPALAFRCPDLSAAKPLHPFEPLLSWAPANPCFLHLTGGCASLWKLGRLKALDTLPTSTVPITSYGGSQRLQVELRGLRWRSCDQTCRPAVDHSGLLEGGGDLLFFFSFAIDSVLYHCLLRLHRRPNDSESCPDRPRSSWDKYSFKRPAAMRLRIPSWLAAIPREWRHPKILTFFFVIELPFTVAALALFGIATPDLYRTQLWQEGSNHGWNSNPNEILYAYANYRPIKTPLPWSQLYLSLLHIHIPPSTH